MKKLKPQRAMNCKRQRDKKDKRIRNPEKVIEVERLKRGGRVTRFQGEQKSGRERGRETERQT